MPNVSDINQLKAGAKLTEGQGAFWRANSDNSVTLFKRIRGKDSRVGNDIQILTSRRFDWPEVALGIVDAIQVQHMKYSG